MTCPGKMCVIKHAIEHTAENVIETRPSTVVILAAVVYCKMVPVTPNMH